MPKVNVYLPDALADAVKKAGVSVSPVCQRALEKETLMMRATSGTDQEQLKAAAARMRGDEQELSDDGYRQGWRWVIQEALPDELRQLSNRSEAEQASYIRDHGHALGWNEDESRPMTNDDYVRGFVDGALAAWEKVEPFL